MILIIFQRLFIEAIVDIFYFPVWWYSSGIKYISQKCFRLLKIGNEELAPGLWLKNLFVPMFGSRDWEGKIISFFMRLVQIIARGFALFIWMWCCIALFLFWLIFPFVVIYGIVGAIFKV